MRVVSIVGARPQFIKAAPVSHVLAASGHLERLLHTGQHYDDEMSAVFFRELRIPEPAYNLEAGSGSHGRQTGRMLERIEAVLVAERPEWVLVYGDTNSTLAGAIAAAKLGLPIAHVEAGLRSFNREMPEEHNRVLTDHCADVLFCPTQTAVDHLAREGVTKGVFLVGDTMYDAVLEYARIAREESSILERLGLSPSAYALATVHRPYNTDVAENLGGIVEALAELGEPVIFPVHPRTRQRLLDLGGRAKDALGARTLRLIDPVGYLDMLKLLQCASRLFTDSGGMQKEAYFLQVPCVTLRPETEWVETVEAGWNVLCGADKRRILEAARLPRPAASADGALFGDGRASVRIVDILVAGCSR